MLCTRCWILTVVLSIICTFIFVNIEAIKQKQSEVKELKSGLDMKTKEIEKLTSIVEVNEGINLIILREFKVYTS